MLTYDFDNVHGPIYEYVYKCIKKDILSGKIQSGEKLPSKRAFANNNGISIITIQNAYEQLISEGYVYTIPKKGYYVAQIEGISRGNHLKKAISYDISIPEEKLYEYDFSNNGISTENFPFSVWNKLSRMVMADKKDELMQRSPVCGVQELRVAIANHLSSFRGMEVDPNQILVGAGTEYLYGLITELLGNDKTYAIENPGYQKLTKIYKQRDIDCRFLEMDEAGVTVEGLNKAETEVAHICPNHHFPTGITMPASRRYEILGWAGEKEGRYVIEDDYDSEFRMEGKPIPTLFSIDNSEKVIYMNTFSKSLSPTIRISYMVLPVHLVNRFYKTLSFYSCTVSNFEQYTLAAFIQQGYFEKHINRMRLYYKKKRQRMIEKIQSSGLARYCEIMDNDSGLHFLMKLDTKHSDREIEEKLEACGLKIRALSDYYFEADNIRKSMFIINYSNLDEDKFDKGIEIIAENIESF